MNTIRLIPFLLATLCSSALAAETADQRLKELGIALPEVSPSIANYVSVVRSGNLLYLAGHIPRTEAGELIVGKLGRDLETADGYEAARRTAIALLATVKGELGNLDSVKRIVKVTGMVNAEADFTEHSLVINGCSDLLVEVFGDRGRHARVAAGMSSLPLGVAVEVEMIVEIE